MFISKINFTLYHLMLDYFNVLRVGIFNESILKRLIVDCYAIVLKPSRRNHQDYPTDAEIYLKYVFLFLKKRKESLFRFLTNE